MDGLKPAIPKKVVFDKIVLVIYDLQKSGSQTIIAYQSAIVPDEENICIGQALKTGLYEQPHQ